MRPVAFVYPGDIEARTGGYGYDRRLVAELSARGHEVNLVSLDGAFPDPGPADIEAALARLSAIAPDHAIIVDGLAFGTLPAAALAGLAAPIVALVHHPLALETGLDPARADTVAATERAALTKAAHVVVTSPHTRDTLVADYGVPQGAITVAIPGLDPGWRQATMRRPVHPPRIVSVASILPRKGFDTLTAALAAIADLDWQADFVGSTERAPETVAALKAQIEAAGLQDRIRLHGEAEEDAIRALYREASVFALASRYEGFGMVFAEAMASGLPIVATRGGAIPDVVPPAAGRLVDVDDAGAFAAALRAILTDPALATRLSEGAAEMGRSFQGWPRTGTLVSDALEAL
ncbi:glycosyltransferase family 4 protein [Acuticoccus kandeliae]|uniref:glycosyltransferase family 4 protein n=1 Tax=Acuticoccus kandeliae TaxID=2073160 RepID=UPI001473A18D|nr:glycosyltransferase family 4 protein [Acuticoccus kandeliae]